MCQDMYFGYQHVHITLMGGKCLISNELLLAPFPFKLLYYVCILYVTIFLEIKNLNEKFILINVEVRREK